MLDEVPVPVASTVVDLDEDTAVHVPAAGSVVLLNRSARAVLRLVDGRRTVGEVLERLAHEHGTTAGALREDVLHLLLDLSAAGLLSAPRARPADGLAVTTMGAVLRLVVPDPALREQLADLLGDLGPAADAPPGAPLVVVRGTGPWTVTSLAHRASAATSEAAVGAVLAALNLSAVRVCPHLAVHAAVLSRTGRTLVLPGRSGLGKTTLTAALLRLGWELVSDEALLLPWEGARAPVPYARPLALSPWSCAALGLPPRADGGERLLRAADLGATVAVGPGPVTDVVLLHRGAGGHGARLRSVPRSSALPELFARGFTTATDPERALPRLRDLLAGAAVHSLELGDPVASARLLDAL